MFRKIRFLPPLAAAATALALAGTASARSLYVAGSTGDGTPGVVSVIDTTTDTASANTIPTGAGPFGIAMTPDGGRVYVPNSGINGSGFPVGNTVTAIDTSTNQAIGGPISTTGNAPFAIAITPDGTRAYVTHFSVGLMDPGRVSVIDTNPSSPTYNTTIQTISAPGVSVGIAITPDGSRAYVTVLTGPATGGVATLDIDPSSPTYNTFVGSTLDLGEGPYIPGITPDGSKLYVPLPTSNSVKVVDTNPSSGSYGTVTQTIAAGIASPFVVAVAPDGSRAYVSSGGTLFGGSPPFPDTVAVIDTATDAATGSPITAGAGPLGVAFTPDGTHAYVANIFGGSVSDIDTGASQSVATTQPGGGPTALAMTPAQGPIAEFTATAAASGSATSFSASGADVASPGGVRFDWDFGDGTTAANAGRTPSHTYATPGTYDAKLTVTADYGSTGGVFTGQTASVRQGAPTTATKTVAVTVPNGESDASAPTVTITGLKKNQKIKRRKFKKVSGTASDVSGIRKVLYALARKGAPAKAGTARKGAVRCHYLKKKSGELTRKAISCKQPRYLRAKGTTSWSAKLKRTLPRGSYTLRVRVTDNAGNRSEPLQVSFRLV